MAGFLPSPFKNGNIYKIIFETSPDAIVILDLQGKLVLVNGRIYDWLQYESKNLIGQNFLELPFLTAEAKETLKINFQKRITGKNIAPYSVVFQEKSGGRRIGLIKANVILDEAGKIIGDLVFISDITKAKINSS